VSVKFSPVPQGLKALGPDASQWLNKLKDKMAGPIADLNQTISNPPTQAEVQALSDKVDALLAALRAKGLMES
jgi:hypothetical protein